jgi:DNA-binding IclR family transcriptional regulator
VSKGLIQSIERAIAVLTLIRHSEEPLTIANMSTVLGIPRTTLYPIIRTLEEYDLVHRDEQSRRLELGWKLYDLGLGYMEQNADIETRDEARRLRMKWQQVVYSGIYAGENLIAYTVVELPDEPHASPPQLGFFAAAHATASGKLHLAHREKKDIDWIFEPGRLVKYTPKTITDPEQLLRELDQIKKQGYAIDDEERNEGAMCIAVPVMNLLGECTKSLSISGPKKEILANFDDMKTDLILSAQRLSQRPWDTIGKRPRTE